MIYDYLVVGSGFFGSVLAHELSAIGKSVMVLEKRNHIGGNAYTEDREGIQVHLYGPHIFHTNNDGIWNYINQFAKFNHFVNRVKAINDNKIYSLPINLLTLNQVAGCTTPSEAEDYLKRVRIPCDNPRNLEDWALSQVGRVLYETLIKGYTTKQWMRSPKDLPASIIKRLPVRTTFDDNYYNDRYQGIPIGGYTQIFKNMLSGIKVELGQDFSLIKNNWRDYAKHLIYSGPIDAFFDYEYGKLEYRTLRFDHERHAGDYQGNAQVNYTNENVPYTRIIEHKHFEFKNLDYTYITKEHPVAWHEGAVPYYSINNQENQQIYSQYRKLAESLKDVTIGGRLGSYQYYDMDQVIAQALATFRKLQ
jgi:UDP-galactopyranose mutase